MPQRKKADIGLIGLAVMGRNLALNIADHGYSVAVYNRTTSVMNQFVADNPDTPAPLRGCVTLREMLDTLKKPRKIIVLVKAGPAVDAVVEQLLEAGLEKRDIVIDCGNSLWLDTIQREKQYADRLKFFGSGVSGGEVGARFGPSLMAGGDPRAFKHIEPIWKAIAAKVNPNTGKPIEGASPGSPVAGGEPCAAYIGPNGAGHYVKMVHNGIEYIDMQLICEAYFLIRSLTGLKPDEISRVFAQWNKGDLDSYLIEITADILQQRDPTDRRRFLVDRILDTAAQKGTGRWTASNALELGIPATSIAEAVFARFLSALKDQRVAASRSLKGPKPRYEGDPQELIDAVRDALYCSKVCAYAQGFELMTQAQEECDWDLDFSQIADIWRGGCIIRARFLQKIAQAYQKSPDLSNLLLAPYFRRMVHQRSESWRKVISLAALNGVSAPAFFSALAYFDGYRSAILPANLLQAQRDYFGAHTYHRTDAPRDTSFHLDWPEQGRPQVEV